MAVDNWTGLMNLCLNQVREKTLEPQSQSTRLNKLIMPGRSFSTQLTQNPLNNIKFPIKYLPSYRLQAKNPVNRDKCKNIIKSIMDESFEEFTYNSLEAGALASQISDRIKQEIKSLNFDRYRYICNVTIGERLWQGYESYMKFFWDEKNDGYLTYVIDDQNFFAQVVFVYLYCD